MDRHRERALEVLRDILDPESARVSG
jgi:hypothetical protein